MEQGVFETLVAQATDGHTPRVWSLLITVFGELAQDLGASISGATLSHLVQPIGVKPEAMRVALHRLRKDGWIDSQKTGRTSRYFLTPWGRDQSAAASPVIYSETAPQAEAWLLTVPSGHDQGLPGVALTPNVVICAQPPEDGAVLACRLDLSQPVPDWVSTRFCPSDLLSHAEHLRDWLTVLEAYLSKGHALSDLQTAALRILIVHSWRRIVLRLPDLPEPLFGAQWAQLSCRSQVRRVLAMLSKPQLSTLETLS